MLQDPVHATLAAVAEAGRNFERALPMLFVSAAPFFLSRGGGITRLVLSFALFPSLPSRFHLFEPPLV